ncbi:hypothetical protein AO715_02790 [Xanthomonas sp. Mitacek01]|nr:hypothetical protein AO715_02790 [Xanthomonas sp. Mitacek01]
MRNWIVAGLVVLVLGAGQVEAEGDASPTGAASAETAARKQHLAEQRYLRTTARALAERGTPRELAFAALLDQAATRPQAPAPGAFLEVDSSPVSSFGDDARAWRMRAAMGAGDDVIANVLLTSGLSEPDAVSLAAAARWADAQPDNGAPWLKRRDLPVDARLDAVAARASVSSESYPTLRWMVEALSVYPPAPAVYAFSYEGEAHDAQDYVMSISAMLVFTSLPGFQEILRACPPGDGEHVGRCGAAADRFSHADTLLTRRVGDALSGRLGVDAPDVLEARRRDEAWQQARLSDVINRVGNARQFALVLDPSVPDEITFRSRLFAEAGVSTEAPDDWVAPAH